MSSAFHRGQTEILAFCSMALRHWVSGSRRFERSSRLCLQPHNQRYSVISQNTSIIEVDIAYFMALRKHLIKGIEGRNKNLSDDSPSHGRQSNITKQM